MDKALERITTEHALGKFGTGSFETENHRLVFTEAGPQAILLTVFVFTIELNSILPYCFLVAEKISTITEGKFTEQHSLSIPNLELGYEFDINPYKGPSNKLKCENNVLPMKTELKYKLLVVPRCRGWQNQSNQSI